MKNKETCSIAGGAKDGSHGNSEEGSDEEIPSDSEEEMKEQDGISDQSEEEGQEYINITRKRLKRKRKRPDWVNMTLYSLTSTIPSP